MHRKRENAVKKIYIYKNKCCETTSNQQQSLKRKEGESGVI